MVKLIHTDDPDRFDYEFDSRSWYNDKVRKAIPYLDKRQAAYIDLLQNTVNVKDALGEIIPYMLTAHQLEFHLLDVLITQEKAKTRVVIKSRNTSLTVSSSIADIFAQTEFDNTVIPYVRLNTRSALDLIETVKGLIKMITPIAIEIPDESRRISPDIDPPTVTTYFPFNPADVKLDLAGSIKFPSGVTLRAFPAASIDTSETIRGLRLRGNFGLIDESNYMRYFKNIFVASRDASAGSKDGVSIEQTTIGTTLKGETEFSDWLENVIKSKTDDIVILTWPVFDPKVFAPYLSGECIIPFHENDKLVSIVEWHDKKKLWNKWILDQHVFKEEYLAIKVDASEQFYPTKLVVDSCDIDGNLEFEELKQYLSNYKEIRIGLDPASTNDCFGITIFGLDLENHWEQLHVSGPQGMELPDSQEMILEMLAKIDACHKNWLCSVDATPIGLQLTQTLRKKYKHKIRGLNGNMRFVNADGLTVKLNEFMHTNLKMWMFEKTLHLIADTEQIKDFTIWNYKFQAASSSRGHGDRVMAIVYALCPRNTESTESVPMAISGKPKNPYLNTGDGILRKFKKRMSEKRNRKVL